MPHGCNFVCCNSTEPNATLWVVHMGFVSHLAFADYPSHLHLQSMVHIGICKVCFTFAFVWCQQLMQLVSAGLHLQVDGKQNQQTVHPLLMCTLRRYLFEVYMPYTWVFEIHIPHADE